MTTYEKKPEYIEVIAENEEDFVDKMMNTKRPCTIWQKHEFDQKKIDQICKDRGVFFIKTNIDGNEGTICLPPRKQS